MLCAPFLASKVTKIQLGHKAMGTFHSQRVILSLDKIGHLMCGTQTKLNAVILNILVLSLGKLIRPGLSFYFESSDKLVAVTPDKQSRFRVELGDDDIRHLPHELRSGKQAAPLSAILQQDIN